MVAAREVVRDLVATDGGHEAVVVALLPDGGRNLPIEAAQRRVDARERAAADDRIGHPHRHTARRPPPRDGPAAGHRRPDDGAGGRRHRDSPRSSASVNCPFRAAGRGRGGGPEVGSINEKGLLDRAYRDPSIVDRTVGEVMDPPLPLVDAAASLDEAFSLLSGASTALVVVRADRPIGIVTKLDLLEYLAHHPTAAG
jgi:CBS domain-containing protein